MRPIRISETVWKEITRWGKPGETPDDILKRLLSIDNRNVRSRQSNISYPTRRMFAKVMKDDHLAVRFANGPSERFLLPAKQDRVAIQRVRDRAVAFAKEYGASLKQVNSIEKALEAAGYLWKPLFCICA